MADKTTDHRKDYGGANPDAAGGAIVMPVVLGNELVHWVGVVPHTDGFGIKTVFPAYDAETAEEKRIN